MKKSIALFLFSILILNLFIISIGAETPPIPNIGIGGEINPETGLPSELEKIKGIGENLTDSEIRSNYLKQEWGKIPAKNKYTAPIMSFFNYISPVTNPIFKYTIGMEPVLSWLFILTFTLWVAFLIYIFRIFELVSPFSKTVQYIISIGIVIILGITGFILKLSNSIISVFSLFTTWWMQLIGIVIIIIALILASIFSKNLQEVFKAMKEKREKAKEEINRKKLGANVKIAETFTKELTK